MVFILIVHRLKMVYVLKIRLLHKIWLHHLLLYRLKLILIYETRLIHYILRLLLWFIIERCLLFINLSSVIIILVILNICLRLWVIHLLLWLLLNLRMFHLKILLLLIWYSSTLFHSIFLKILYFFYFCKIDFFHIFVG
jgi:hypothetical protein